MNITFRRHYKIVLALLATILLCIFWIGKVRIISYNFENKKETENTEEVSKTEINYENEIDLFDDSVVHEIKISMADGDYEEMIETYKETGLKEYFKANVLIDGVEVKEVGIRLKGNLTLRQSLGGSAGGDMGGGMPKGARPEGMGEIPEFPEGLELPEGMEFPEGMELPEGFVPPENPFSETMEEVKGEPPFLIKFDEFIEGQTYQSYAEIALRIGSFNTDAGLLKEQVAFYIHDQVGQIVPQTSYAYVKTADQSPSLYVITEHLDQSFIEKNFEDSDGILYKAANFVGFEYLGEDPTLYLEKFEQETNVNKDDMSPLIDFLEFVSESTDEQFETDLPKWIDMESFVRMMALDNLLGNDDSFVGMGSNYYLYYDKIEKKFTMLSWDMNLAMGGMGGMGGNKRNMQEAEEARPQRQMPDGQAAGEPKAGIGRNGTNTLKTRFFENKTFSAIYDDEYTRLKKIIYSDGLALKKIQELSAVFTEYNKENAVMDQSEYDKSVENIKTFIQSKK